MIQQNGFKAFRGVMRITPVNPDFEPFEIDSDWVYVPEYDCWYGGGRSFVSRCCTVLSEHDIVKPEAKPLVLCMNKDGVWEEKKEPYMTVECMSKEDFEWLVDAIARKRQGEDNGTNQDS